jgi:hypothetical protein
VNTRSAEAALTVDSRGELVFLLGQACEIEHGLMCEYLYAQFSLKRRLDEGVPENLDLKRKIFALLGQAGTGGRGAGRNIDGAVQPAPLGPL